MRVTGQNRWLMTLIALLLVGATGALAGEAPPPGPPAGAPEAAPEGEKKPQTEETFNFVPGDRRDPFTFTRVIPKVAPPSTGTTNNPDQDNNAPQRMDAAQIAAKRNEAMSYYAQGETSLMEMNATEAMARCDRGLEVFKDVQMNLYKELQEVRDLLLRLRKAAERIRSRQDAERDFSMMNIHLTGVVARDKNSQAIVNAKVVGKGDVVPSTTEGADIVVADILPQQVVFIYRGYKMMLTLSEIGR